VLKHRVIPCLLLHDRGLVKTTRFAKPQYVGDPVNAIRIFNEKEVDELVVLDIEASTAGREPAYDLIADFAGECFMPLCYGGGIRTVDQAQRLFALGVEKVCVRTGALRNLQLVSDIATRFGNQSVVVSVDVSKNMFGRYRLHPVKDVATMPDNWESFLTSAVNAGAGEILLNAVDRDGTMAGIDAKLISAAAKDCRVPLIACGGVGSLADIKSAVMAGANAVAAGAFFVYHGPHRAVLITYPRHDELVGLLGS
jgi:cyclase